jgi:hypothetical protein
MNEGRWIQFEIERRGRHKYVLLETKESGVETFFGVFPRWSVREARTIEELLDWFETKYKGGIRYRRREIGKNGKHVSISGSFYKPYAAIR